MRFQGHNVLAILVAAIVIYALEFVVFAVLISPEQYEAYIGANSEQLFPDRMPFGAISPILTAIGLSLAVKWRNAPGWMGGMVTSVFMALTFGVAVSLYAWVYGSHTTAYLPVNIGHLLVCWGAAGAVLGAWK